MMNREAYTGFLQALLPVGFAWTREKAANLTKVLDAGASELALIDARSGDLITEADPRSAFELLADWERVAGLPDNCSGVAETLQERRQAVTQKITSRGGQSRAYYISMALSLGYTITIQEFRPFICGLSRCGARLNGGHSVRNHWLVKVPNPRATYFRTGISRAGERLLTIRRAEDLECALNHIKPAHTNLIFSYEGV